MVGSVALQDYTKACSRLFELLSWTTPENALDDAASGKCKLKADADVPSYET